MYHTDLSETAQTLTIGRQLYNHHQQSIYKPQALQQVTNTPSAGVVVQSVLEVGPRPANDQLRPTTFTKSR